MLLLQRTSRAGVTHFGNLKGGLERLKKVYWPVFAVANKWRKKAGANSLVIIQKTMNGEKSGSLLANAQEQPNFTCWKKNRRGSKLKGSRCLQWKMSWESDGNAQCYSQEETIRFEELIGRPICLSCMKRTYWLRCTRESPHIRALAKGIQWAWGNQGEGWPLQI